MGHIHSPWTHAVLASAALLAACSSIEPRDEAIRAKAASATTRDQHLEVASLYASRAAEERNAAGRHAAAAAQERWTIDTLNRNRRHLIPSIMRGHCDALEAMHTRAAEENGAAAEEHRRMAMAAAG